MPLFCCFFGLLYDRLILALLLATVAETTECFLIAYGVILHSNRLIMVD